VDGSTQSDSGLVDAGHGDSSIRGDRIRGWIAVVARLGLVVVFGWSGFAKAADPIATVTAVRAYSLVPTSWVKPVATALPWFEVALAVLLLLGLALRFTAVLSALLLIAFIAGVISAAARGLAIDCGCFGGGGAVAPGDTRYTEEILRDVGFLLLAAYLVWWPRSPLSVDGMVGRTQIEQA
jgi:uncharacterized membrane protein YphA (DoxX/SURF4 family)